VLDVYGRRVVGWSIDSSPTASLSTNALGMALKNRIPIDGETLIHSDQGSQLRGVHRASEGVRARTVDGIDRRLLRQRRNRGVLGTLADRAPEHPALGRGRSTSGISSAARMSYGNHSHLN
jgi:hypothetical protein